MAEKRACLKDISRDAAVWSCTVKKGSRHRQQHKKSSWLSTVDNTFESDVMIVSKQSKYAYLLEQYPEFINKEQMFRICKISKWSAAYLLKNGMVPCVDNGKATHKFSIAMRDVVAYLEDRESYPEKYFIPPRPRPKKNNPNPSTELIETPGYLAKLKAHFSMELEQYEDVLNTHDAGKALGYAHKTILAWINRGDIEVFLMGRKYFIAKACLLKFMMSKNYRGIMQKSAAHATLMGRFSK